MDLSKIDTGIPLSPKPFIAFVSIWRKRDHPKGRVSTNRERKHQRKQAIELEIVLMVENYRTEKRTQNGKI